MIIYIWKTIYIWYCYFVVNIITNPCWAWSPPSNDMFYMYAFNTPVH